MLMNLKQWLAPPVFEGDDEKTRIARMLNTLAVAAMALLLLAGMILIPLRWGQPDIVPNVLRMAVAVALLLFILILIRRGRVRLASLIFSLVVWVNGFVISYTTGGIRSYEFPTVMVVVLAVGLLLGVRAAIVTVGLSILAELGFIYLGANDLLLPFDPASYTPTQILVSRTIGLAAMVVLLYLFKQGLDRVSQRAQLHAAELESYREQLKETVAQRTQDLARRTHHLEATAEVARDASSVLDLQKLLTRVVHLINERFGYYHTGIFLLDPAGEWAVLQAASSRGGQRMLARKHRLKVGEVGIVGYVTGEGEARVALDVGIDAVFFDNPDLPETRSEMALPLRARGEVIGALDVQSKEAGAFSDEDVVVLQILADQVAVAISNARLFQQAQESLEVERRAYGELSREAWLELLRSRSDLGFFQDEHGVTPAGDLWRPEMETVLQSKEMTLDEDRNGALALPIKVRDDVVGVIEVRKPDDSDEWLSEEITMLETVVEQLGVALESARLYQDTQRRAARERLTGEIAARMRESLDVETVLKTTVNEMYQALGFDEVVVRLVSDEHDNATAE